MMKMYQCTECNAQDLDRGLNGQNPLALVCWNCKAGGVSPQSGKSIGPMDQLHVQYGMIPVPDVSG